MSIKEKILNELNLFSDEKYKKFSMGLLPNVKNILGVRLPVLRKFAKEISCSKNWKEYIGIEKTDYFEETMLQGMIIGYLQEPVDKKLCYIKNFILKIDNWSVCDSFCSGLKFTKNNQETVWDFIQPYFLSKKEYELRFAYVMLLNYFVDYNYIDRIFLLTEKFVDDRYYSKMAVAWLISICYIKYPEQTLNYLKKTNLSNWTFNKSIQKICESNQISKNEKLYLRTLKQK